MMDTKQLLEALEPPAFRAPDGREFRGRHVSLIGWLRYAADADAVGRKSLSPIELQLVYQRLCRAWFPRPPFWGRVRGWLRRLFRLDGPREQYADEAFIALPLAVQNELLKHFFNCQARAFGAEESAQTQLVKTP